MHWRHLLNYLPFIIAVVVLRKINKETRTSVVDCDVNAWQLIETCIMVTNCHQNGHHVAKSGGNLAIHIKERVPSVRASWHIVIVCDVSTHKENIRVKGRHNFTQVYCSFSISGISSIDHADRDIRVRWQCFVYSISPILLVIVNLCQIFSVRFKSINQSWMHSSCCFPLQTIVLEGVGCHVLELITWWAIKFFVKYC